MNLKAQITSLIVLIICSPIFGQEQDTKKIQRILIQDVSIMGGSISEANTHLTANDFRVLAPQSMLLKTDFSNYSQTHATYLNTNNTFSINMGIQFSDKQKTRYRPNPWLRVGISYFSSNSINTEFQKTDRRPSDTLVSAQTGNIIYVDSATTRSYQMSYYSENLRFDASLIFRTDPEDRWSLYTGVGITTGISINSGTTINYNEYERSEVYTAKGNNYNYNYNYFGFSGNENKSEYNKSKSNFAFSTYIPIGVDFRIGGRREFWERTHLFYEIRPAITFTSIPGLETFTNFGVQHGFGIRVVRK